MYGAGFAKCNIAKRKAQDHAGTSGLRAFQRNQNLKLSAARATLTLVLLHE
jgi:hypothetical protein